MRHSNVYIDPDPKAMQNREYFAIGFDMDSVLNEMSVDLGNYIANKYDRDPKHIHKVSWPDGFEKFHFYVPGVSGNAIAKDVRKFVCEESIKAIASPYMSDILKWVYKVTGKPILIVTARPAEAVDTTVEWLVRNLDRHTPFLLYMVSGHDKKAAILDWHCVNIFVEDRYRTVWNLGGHISEPVLYKRPWNQGRGGCSGAIEIRDLRDVIPVLNIKLNRVPTDWPCGVPFPKPNKKGS